MSSNQCQSNFFFRQPGKFETTRRKFVVDDFSIFQEYKIYSNTQIEWPGSDKPNDEPSCGFNNELCPKPNTHLNSIIAAGALAITLFCAGVITMSIYRKWKIEQEIEGLLWKIDRHDIHSYFERDIVSSPSRVCYQLLPSI